MNLLKYLIVILLLILSSAFIGWLIVSVLLPPKGVETPDLTGLTLVEALKKSEDSNLNLRLKEQHFNGKIPKYHIITQEPIAGQIIRPGRKISVILSKGPQEVVIPDLSDLPRREVESYLARAGLQVGFISKVHSENYQLDTLIAQNPLPGYRSMVGQKVNLLISLGSSPRFYVMPDWIGNTINRVRTLAISMNIRTEISRRQVAPEYNPGTILDQTPKAGYRIQEGDIARLIISRKTRLGKNETIDYQPFLYVVPMGHFPRQLKITLAGIDNEEIVLLQRQVEPEEKIYELFPRKEGTFLKVYLNGQLKLVEESETSHNN